MTRLFAVVATGVIATLGTSAGTGARVSLVTASGAHSQIPVLTRGRDAALRKLLAAAARAVHAPGGVLLVKTPRFPTRCGDAWGHRGRTLGYTAYMLSTTDARRILVFLLNTGHLEDDAIVRLDPYVERALCM